MKQHVFDPDWVKDPKVMEEILLSTMLEYQEVIDELISLNLWQARRLKEQQSKKFAYDELEEITGQTYERL